MTFTEKLNRLLRDRKVFLIAEDVGVSRGAMNNYLNRGSEPRGSVALRIARRLNVSVDWLLDDTQDWPPIYERSEQPHQHESPAA